MVFSFLRRAAAPARRRALSAAGPATIRPGLLTPCPDEPVCLLGDLHGRSDLLKRFLTLRDAHFPNARIIFLGDMIDRGPDSAGVLTLVREEVAKGAIALSGNHEAMFLDFLYQPEKGLSWLKHGGVEMLASFGLEPDRPEALCDGIRTRLGEDMIAWLRALPLYWQSGTLAAAHAGMDPQRPVTDQDPQVLQWGHREFGRILRRDGIWVAHGHTVMDRAFAHAGRIALDTGAYATGRLSFAVIDPDLPETERLMIAVTP